MDWAQLEKTLLSGDASTFSIVARDILLRLARQMVRGVRIDREEVAHDALCNLLIRFARLRQLTGEFIQNHPDIPARPFLHTTLLNALRQELRRAGNRPLTTVEQPPESIRGHRSADSDAAASEEMGQMMQALETLPIRDRVMLRLQMLAIAPQDEMDRYALSEEERAWKPDTSQYPRAKTAGRVADKIVKKRKGDPSFTVTADFLAVELGVNNRDVIDQWLHRARERLAKAVRQGRKQQDEE